jgi:hypothetical protein
LTSEATSVSRNGQLPMISYSSCRLRTRAKSRACQRIGSIACGVSTRVS